MKASELRIGNWFINHYAEPETTIYWQVESIERASSRKGKLGVRYRKGSCWIIAEDMEPIPLTPEWLERFGAKKIQYNQRIYYNIDIIPVFDDGGLVLSYWFLPNGELESVWLVSEELEYDNSIQDERSWNYTKKLGMVHQLQNFYYTHKGEELEIND